MPNTPSKTKRFFGSLILGIVFIIIFFALSQKKTQETINLKNQSEYAFSRTPVADPTKKAQPELPELLLIQNTTLKGALPPYSVSAQVLGALVGGFEPEDVQKVIVEYVTEQGDTISSLAQKFNVSVNTILWANSLTQSSILKPGQKLIIPPVSGIIHHVKAGDTVTEVAKKYSAKSEEIISFNSLSDEADVFVGDILVIPNGVMPKPKVVYVPETTPIAKNYFICPITLPCRLSQGLHWYNAVDLTHGQCGEPIYAAAGGKVLKVKITASTSRWAFGGAGNTISILHPNGVVTSYGHIAVSFVSPGDEVLPGDKIALMGGQPGTPGAGLSTGCHLHFGVTGAANSFAK